MTVRVLVGALCCAVAAVAVAPIASAAPGDPTGAVGWDRLGTSSQLTFTSADDPQSVSLPVSQGTAITRIRGNIHAPVGFGAGYLEIDDESSRVLATVPLPDGSASEAQVPFEVAVPAVPVADGSADLSFVVRQRAARTDQCGPAQTLLVSDLVAQYSGTPTTPTSVADFFPAVLDRLRIVVPTDADAAEQQSALSVAAAVTRRYGPQKVAVGVESVTRGTTPTAAAAGERVVDIARSDDAAVTLRSSGQAQWLQIGGSGAQLVSQTSLFGSQIVPLAQTARASVSTPETLTTPGTNVLSFDTLGMTGSIDVRGSGVLGVGVDRARLGIGTVSSATIHLRADYTPVSDGDSATAVIRAGGAVVRTERLGGSGRLDTTFDVPGGRIGQRLGLDVTVTYASRLGCSTAPLTFQIDPTSTVQLSRGGPASGGFAALPSALAPTFLVALDGTSGGQLDTAVRLTADVVRQTTAAMTPRLTGLEEAAKSGSGAIVVATADTVRRLGITPPLGAGDGGQVSEADGLVANVGGSVGSVQAFVDRPRDRTVLLATTSGGWGLLAPVLGFIDGQSNGIASLTGDVVAAGSAGRASNLSVGNEAPAERDAPSSSWQLWAWVSLAVVLVIALGAVVMWWRRRRAWP